MAVEEPLRLWQFSHSKKTSNTFKGLENETKQEVKSQGTRSREEPISPQLHYQPGPKIKTIFPSYHLAIWTGDSYHQWDQTGVSHSNFSHRKFVFTQEQIHDHSQGVLFFVCVTAAFQSLEKVLYWSKPHIVEPDGRISSMCHLLKMTYLHF